MPLDSGELKARWKTDEGKELLQKVYTALQARAPCTDILAGFPGVEEIASGLDLRGADLSSASLSGADLSNADLSQANFALTVLRDADLKNANLSDANLSSANLSDANLSDANLSGTNLHGTNLRGADLSSADLSGAKLRGADLRRADLSGANLRGAGLRRVNPGNPELRDVKLRADDFSNVRFDDVDHRDNDLGNANLDGTTPTPALFPKGGTSPTIRKRTCPYCAEVVLAGAKKCKHCGEFIVSPVKSGTKSINAGSNGRLSSSEDPIVGAIAGLIIIVMVFYLAMSFDGCLTGRSKSGGGNTSDSSEWRSKEEKLADYHRQGRFRGYTDPDELQRDMKILGDGGAKEAEAVYDELHWMSK